MPLFQFSKLELEKSFDHVNKKRDTGSPKPKKYFPIAIKWVEE